MLDLSRFTDVLSDLIGHATSGAADNGNAIYDFVANAGLDPAMLEGLGASELIDLLGQNGIDIAGMAPDQITELLTQLGAGEEISALATQLLADRLGSG